MSSRIVTVFGATGTQGAALIQGLLKDGTFTPRAITRDPGSESSTELKAQGAEVVKADSADKASLISALSGSEAVFAVTFPNFTPDQDVPNEVVQGKNIVDAAKEVGVKFFIFTGMPSIARISGGKYKSVFLYDHKEEVENYLKASGLPHAILHLPAFLENFWKFGLLKKTDTGYNIAVSSYKPTDKQAFGWIEREVPAATLALLKNYTDPSKNISGKTYPIVNACISYAELAAMTDKALGVEVTFTTAPPSGVAQMDEMWAALAEYSGLFTATPVPNPDLVALGVKFATIEEFLQAEVKPRYGQK